MEKFLENSVQFIRTKRRLHAAKCYKKDNGKPGPNIANGAKD